MKHHDLEQILVANGFWKVRSNKHEIWSNGKIVTVLPFHKNINKFTAKSVLKAISKGVAA